MIDTILKIPTQPPFGTDLPTYLQWVFNVGMALGFAFVLLAFAVSGAYFIVSQASVEWKSKAKEWFSGALTGLLIFTCFYLIITTLNPALAIFRFGEPLSIPEGQTIQAVTNPGLYFYENENCQGDAFGYLDNPADIFSQSKAIRSVKLVSDSLYNVFSQNHYFAVIYGENDFQGKCQVYFTPSCYNIKINQINSVMIKKFKTLGGFGDMTFYRYPFFNEKGGSKKLSMIPGLSAVWANGYYLKNLKFADDSECSVPLKEQDCIQWDNQGICVKRQCPNLEGKNIASIKTNGNFLTMLSYKGPADGNDIDTFCQTYPNIEDINKIGPKQIKWDAINNNLAFPLIYYPNYIRVIFLAL